MFISHTDAAATGTLLFTLLVGTFLERQCDTSHISEIAIIKRKEMHSLIFHE